MSIYGKYPCVYYVYYNECEELIVVVYDGTPKDEKDNILRENIEVKKVLTIKEDKMNRD